MSRSSEHRAQEASCLKAALKGRDVLLEEVQGRVRQLEDELARCGGVCVLGGGPWSTAQHLQQGWCCGCGQQQGLQRWVRHGRCLME